METKLRWNDVQFWGNAEIRVTTGGTPEEMHRQLYELFRCSVAESPPWRSWLYGKTMVMCGNGSIERANRLTDTHVFPYNVGPVSPSHFYAFRKHAHVIIELFTQKVLTSKDGTQVAHIWANVNLVAMKPVLYYDQYA